MADELNRNRLITRFCWRLVDTFSEILATEEREAVRGDLAESGETGPKAVEEILGLVVRRQGALWMSWRPWLTLLGLIVPLGMLLSIVAKSMSDVSAVYLWMYANNWDWGFVSNAGFWYEAAHCTRILLALSITLACWSWTAGYALGASSRPIFRTNRVLFCLMLLFGVLVGAPGYFSLYFHHLHRLFPLPELPNPNAPVFGLAFYRVIFPLIVQVFLVATPSLLGMRQGTNAIALPRCLQIVFWSIAIATLVAVVIQEPGFGLWLKTYRRPQFWHSGQVRLFQFVAYWPVLYFLGIAISKRRINKIAVA